MSTCQHVSGCYDDAVVLHRWWLLNPDELVHESKLCASCANVDAEHRWYGDVPTLVVTKLPPTDLACPGDVVIWNGVSGAEYVGRVRCVDLVKQFATVDFDDGDTSDCTRHSLTVLERCGLPTKAVGDLSRVLDVDRAPIAFKEAA